MADPQLVFVTATVVLLTPMTLWIALSLLRDRRRHRREQRRRCNIAHARIRDYFMVRKRRPMLSDMRER